MMSEKRDHSLRSLKEERPLALLVERRETIRCAHLVAEFNRSGRSKTTRFAHLVAVWLVLSVVEVNRSGRSKTIGFAH